jgi:hypothetical protein
MSLGGSTAALSLGGQLQRAQRAFGTRQVIALHGPRPAPEVSDGRKSDPFHVRIV